MTQAGYGEIVVDTGVFGASMGPRRGQLLASGYGPLLEGYRAVISFVTETELRFGAAAAGWGPSRLQKLEQRLALARTVWATRQLMASYVELRTWCVRHGHGLAQKEHETDRWVAATARYLRVPLVAHDAIFFGLPGVDLITRLPGPGKLSTDDDEP